MLQVCVWALDQALSKQSVYEKAHVVVIDNASPVPLTCNEWDFVDDLVRFDSHHSFSYCVNAGAARYPQDDLLLLNNDCFPHPDVVQKMADCLTDDLVGIVGARLVFPDGTLQHDGVAQYPAGPGHLGYLQPPFSGPTVTYPTAVTGALMLIRRQAFDEVGGFDERYEFGSEDIDFCHRVRQSGWRIACERSVESVHFESSTPGRIERDAPSRQTYLSTWASRVTHEFHERDDHV